MLNIGALIRTTYTYCNCGLIYPKTPFLIIKALKLWDCGSSHRLEGFLLCSFTSRLRRDACTFKAPCEVETADTDTSWMAFWQIARKRCRPRRLRLHKRRRRAKARSRATSCGSSDSRAEGFLGSCTDSDYGLRVVV